MTVIDRPGPNIRQRALLALAAQKLSIAISALDLAQALLAQGLQRQAGSALLAASESLRQARRLIQTADAVPAAPCGTAQYVHPIVQELAA